MRHIALVALLLASCAPPLNDPDPPRPTVWTRDSAPEEDASTPPPDTRVEEDAGPPDSAEEAPADTYAPPPDTAPPDTGCVAPHWSKICVGPDAGVLLSLCGPAAAGCGGSVDCGACTLQRRCARSPGDGVAGRCSCLHRIGDLCETSKGVAGVEYDCRAGDVPVDPRAEVIPQPDGKISRWCVP